MQIFIIIFLFLFLIGGVVIFSFLIIRNKKEIENLNSTENINEKEIKNSKDNDKKDSNVKVRDSRDLLGFDSLIYCNKEHSLVKINKNKYVGIIEVKGVAFNLLSRREQIRLEEGFQNILNGLNYDCQIYIQCRNIEVEDYVNLYNEKISKKEEALTRLNSEDIEKKSEQEKLILLDKLDKLDKQLEYAYNLRDYIIDTLCRERLIEKKYYIIVDHTHTSTSEDESEWDILDESYSSIWNKISLFIENMPMYKMKCSLLDLGGLAEVLYYAENKEYAKLLTIKKAINAKYSHLITTSKPIEIKKIELDKEINKIEIEELINQIEVMEKEQMKDV